MLFRSKENSECSKKSDNDQDKSEGSVKDTAQSKELLEQQISISPQKNIPPLNEQQPSIRIELEKEWETFNDLINVEGQNTQTLVSNVQTAKGLVTGISGNVTETEHIPITPSSELVLKIEKIPPLDIFYSPQHKEVVRKQRKKRKLESVISHDAEQLDVLWQDPTTNPTENLGKLSQITGAYAFCNYR